MKMEVIVSKPFKEAFQKILNVSMPLKIGVSVIKAAKEVETHQDEYLNFRKDLIEKLADRDADGKFKTEIVDGSQRVKFKDEDAALQFDAAIGSFLKKSVELKNKIDVEVIGDYVGMAPKDLYVLDEILEY